jgi:hypothetical protein
MSFFLDLYYMSFFPLVIVLYVLLSRVILLYGFTTIYAISAYHHWCCEFKSRSGRGVQHYVIFLWFSAGTAVSSTNKTDRHDITEILLKVTLSTINVPFFPGCSPWLCLSILISVPTCSTGRLISWERGASAGCAELNSSWEWNVYECFVYGEVHDLFK